MKSKLILMCAAMAILLGLFACSSEVAVDASYNGKEIKVPVGGSLTITLELNATTGFQWELAGITDQTVLEKVDNKYEASEAGAPIGAAGREVWTFRTLKEGESIISMEYSRPWEGGEKAAKTFSLIVVVE